MKPIQLSVPLVSSLFLATAVLAQPGSAVALSVEEARHLLSRSGFAGKPGEIEALAGLSRSQAVAQLLDQASPEAVTPPPAWSAAWVPTRVADISQEERLALREKLHEQALDLKAWWFREMLDSPTPLSEVMTLFWHGHFTSGLTKVKAPALLYRQNVLLRRHALGNFGALLHAIARDPAMLLYLDNARSRKLAPNENFARELLELFTLGEGRYTEADMKETARAFTGWSVDRDSGVFRFRARQHDGGEKRILGRRARFDGDQVIDLLLEQPETARLVVGKLWRHFVSERLDPAEIERLAGIFRNSGYELKPLLAALFESQAFWDPDNRGRLIKSPVDFVVGTLRLFDLPVRKDGDLVWISRRLGQDLFEPPNVKGWPGGAAWITGATLLDRQALMARVTGQQSKDMAMATGAAGSRRSALFDRWVADLPGGWQEAEKVTLLVLAVPPVDAAVLDRRASGALVRSLLADPAYHLK